MKRLALVIMVAALLIPAQVCAQRGAGAFMQGLANGMAASQGRYVPPPPPPVVVQDPPIVRPSYQPPQTKSGAIFGPNGQTYLYQINPGGNSVIYGPHGSTFLGN